MKRLFIAILFGFVLCGCAILEPAQVKRFKDIESYTYAYINAAQTLNSGVGGSVPIYGSGTYGYYTSKSVNPTDVIAGILMKRGLIVSNTPDNPKTVIVSYGQSGQRYVAGGLGGYTLEVSIQMIDAQTKEPIYICTAEGQGSTEADDIREAVNRCLEGL